MRKDEALVYLAVMKEQLNTAEKHEVDEGSELAGYIAKQREALEFAIEQLTRDDTLVVTKEQ